jgi:hypothetical protein
MNKVVPLLVFFCSVLQSRPAAAEEEKGASDLISELSRSIEIAHERMWRIQDDASRKRVGGIASGLILDGGWDRKSDRFVMHVAPVIAARIYLFDSDPVLASRALERLQHLEEFSLPDAERLIAEARRSITSRDTQLAGAVTEMTSQGTALRADILLLQAQVKECPSPGAPNKDADWSPGREAACQENGIRLRSSVERTNYLARRIEEAQGARVDIVKDLKQLERADQEIKGLKAAINVLRDKAARAARGALFGGSYAEAIVGMGMDVRTLDKVDDAAATDLLVGAGYGIRSWLSAGVFLSPQILGLYVGVTVPVFEH